MITAAAAAAVDCRSSSGCSGLLCSRFASAAQL